MTRIIRSAEPDAFFHDDAGCIVAPGKPADLVPLLLIARCGSLGLKSDGSLVRISRTEEWPDGLYGEWEEVNGQKMTLDEAVELVEGVEAMLLLPPRTLDMETLWLACQVFAQATAVHSIPLRTTLEKVGDLSKQLDGLQDLLCNLHDRQQELQQKLSRGRRS